MINRFLSDTIKAVLNKNKAIVILGARQVGKTTLLNNLVLDKQDCLWLNADLSDVQNMFEVTSLVRLKSIIGKHKLIIIDEAQRIENIGLKLKIMVDEFKEVQIIATGSSSFDLANKINEPLTGRKYEYSLFPLSFEEMRNHHGLFEELNSLHKRLIFGYYPEVVVNPGNEIDILKTLSNSYLYKDLLSWQSIKKPNKIVKLLQALAFQVGNQVSYNELSQIVGLHHDTAELYIDLLEKSFIIYRLSSFSRNLRNELKQSRKIYFYDNGIRNALIGNFNPIELRNDVGALWENYIISERIKFTHYHKIYCNRYFWRTHAQQEIDYLEERDGKLFAYEFKWKTHKKVKIPNSFSKAYPDAETKIITPDNYYQFITQVDE